MADTLLWAWLGQRVAVIVDRPLGSAHPEHPDIVYSINYGYIPGTEAGDAMPIDAYIIGVDVPVSSFLGEVIAIVVRRNDIEDKLVVAPAGMELTGEEVEQAVAFQEQYFESTIVTASDHV